MTARTAERSLFVTLLAGIPLAVITAILASTSGLESLRALLPFLVLGAALAVFVYTRLRLGRIAEDEARELQSLVPDPTTSLFADQPAETQAFTLARTVSHIDRWVAPALAPLLALLQGFWAWRLFQGIHDLAPAASQALAVASYLGAQGFVLFILHRYLLGLARETYRIIRAPALLLGLASYLSILTALAAGAVHLGFPHIDDLLAIAFIFLLALLSLESFWSCLLILYSPQRRAYAATAFISRLAAIVVDPAGWTRTLSQSVDYQFGFSFSQTGFARFVRKSLLPFFIFQILVVYAFSSLVIIAPHEVGLKERFGRLLPDQPHLHPGFHLKAPWPFETVHRVPARQLLRTVIGYHHDQKTPPRVMLWTVPHYDHEDTFLTASRRPELESGPGSAVPVNLITLNMPIEFEITDPVRYAYGFTDPTALLTDIAYRAALLELARRDLSDVLGIDRLAISHAIRQRIIHQLDTIDLGITLRFIGLQGIHPPVPIASAFQDVVGALEQKEAEILLARAYANSILPTAAADARAQIRGAEAYRNRRETLARAEAEQFRARILASQPAPHVFRNRAYLDTLQRAIAQRPKIILGLPGNAPEVLWLNLEPKPFTSVFDLSFD